MGLIVHPELRQIVFDEGYWPKYPVCATLEKNVKMIYSCMSGEQRNQKERNVSMK